jgi:hypothetical protein
MRGLVRLHLSPKSVAQVAENPCQRKGDWVLIEPGNHNISCPSDNNFPFVIPEGFVYKFQYWGLSP